MKPKPVRRRDVTGKRVGSVENRAIVGALNCDDLKRNIVRDLLEFLSRNEERYQADLVRPMIEASRINDFNHLGRLEEGAAEAKQSRLHPDRTRRPGTVVQ